MSGDPTAALDAARDYREVHDVRDEVGKLLLSPGPDDEKYLKIEAAIERLVAFDRFGMTVKDRQSGLFRMVCAGAPRASAVEAWSGELPAHPELVRQLAANRRGIVFRFRPDDVAFVPAYEAGLRSAIVWPFLNGDEFIGFLFVASANSDVYAETDVDRIGPIVDTISQWISIGQERAYHLEVQRRFGDLYEHAPDPFQTLDAAGRILDANLAAIELMGRRRETVVGTPFRAVLADESGPVFDEAFARLKRVGEIANIDLTIVRPEGTRREVVWNSTAAMGPENRFDYSRDVMRDVTHVRRLWRERSVRSAVIASLIRSRSARDVAQNALRALVDGHDICAGRIDVWEPSTSTLTWCAGVGLARWKADPGAPTPIAEHVAREAIHRRETVKITLGTSPTQFEDPALRDVVGTLILFPLAMRGRTLGVLSLVHMRTGAAVDDDIRILGAIAGDVSVVFDNARLYDDLDETNRQLVRRQREEIHREKLAAVGQLAAGIAHEINNPLMFILGNLNLLQEQLDAVGASLGAYRAAVKDPAERERLAVIEQGYGTGLGASGTDSDAARLVEDTLSGVRRIRDVVGTLLRFSKGSPEEASLTDIRVVIRRAMAVVHNEVAHRATLVTAFGDVPLVRCVPGNIEQALVNLLLNAAQAIEPGHAGTNSVTIKTWSDGNGAMVRISDTGHGIAANDLSRITEPFFSTKPMHEGTGLGLALVHEIIRNAGGEVVIQSEEGLGTSVTLSLPLPVRHARTVAFPTDGAAPVARREEQRPLEAVRGEAHRPPGQPQTPTSAAPTTLARRRIMIVDDEELTLKLLSRIFGKAYDLLVAASGSQALSLLESESSRPPDFILCDLMMPDLTGMEFFGQLESRYPTLAERTFFLTGGAFTDEARRFVDRMGPRVFFKPLEIHQIRNLLDEQLRKIEGGATA